MKYHLFLLLILLSNNLYCQDNFEELDFLFPGDSIPSNSFMLDEVTVFQPLKFKSDEEIKRYVILRYRVKKVYPYAKLASERMNRIDSRVDSIKSNRQKRLYLKKLEKFVRITDYLHLTKTLSLKICELKEKLKIRICLTYASVAIDLLLAGIVVTSASQPEWHGGKWWGCSSSSPFESPTEWCCSSGGGLPALPQPRFRA